MVASRQVEIPVYIDTDRQRRRGFGALAQAIGKSAIPFCVNISSQLQNAWVLICWNLLCQKLQRLLVVERISRQLLRVWEDKLWENSWVVVARKGLQAESFQKNLQNKSVGREETFLQTFLINHFEFFSVPTFCGSFWKSWREGPNSWRCLAVPWTRNLSYYLTRWKLHIDCISNGSELLRWFETDKLALKLNFVKGRDYETYSFKTVKKRTTKRTQKGIRKQRKKSNRFQFLSLLLKTTFSTQTFSMLNYLNTTSTINIATIQMASIGLYITFPTTSSGPSSITRDFCSAKVPTMKIFRMKFWKRLCLNLFSQREWKCLTDPMASCCMLN